MTIIAAAIQQNRLIFILPQPSRHHHILHLMAELGLPTPITGKQGFINSYGDFVDRELGAQIAIADGQIQKLRWPPDLYSEDLW